jgi:hypothetical protein
MAQPEVEIMTTTMDPTKIEAAAGKVFGELGVFLSAPMLILGDRLGLFQALLDAGPVTPDELAERTGLHERYLREWLRAVAVGGYVGTTRRPDGSTSSRRWPRCCWTTRRSR